METFRHPFLDVPILFLRKGTGARSLSQSGLPGLLRFIEFSWISLFICYATIPCLPEVFGCLTAWNSLWPTRRVRWLHRMINNSLAKLRPSQSTLPRHPRPGNVLLGRSGRSRTWRPDPQPSWSVDCPGRPHYPGRGWASSPASCGALWELPSKYRLPVDGLFIFGSATCRWWRHERSGYAPFGSSKALSQVRGPRTTS